MDYETDTMQLLALVLSGIDALDAWHEDNSTLLTLVATADWRAPLQLIRLLLERHARNRHAHHLTATGSSVATVWWSQICERSEGILTNAWKAMVSCRINHLRMLATFESQDFMPCWEAGNEDEGRDFFRTSFAALEPLQTMFVVTQLVTSGLLARLRGVHDAPVLSAVADGIEAAIEQGDNGDLVLFRSMWGLATTPLDNVPMLRSMWGSTMQRAAAGDALGVGLVRCFARNMLVPVCSDELLAVLPPVAFDPIDEAVNR